LCACSIPAGAVTLWVLLNIGPADPAVLKGMTVTL